MTSLLIAATLLQAGPVSPPVDRRYTEQASREESERTLQLYADCLVRKRAMQPKIQQFLRTPPNTEQFAQRGIALVDKACAPRARTGYEMRIDPALMQTALYSALYRTRFAKDTTDISGRAPLDFATEFDAPASSVPAQYLTLREVGDCIVRRNAPAARAVILSRLGSDTEKAAIATLMPDVQSCVRQGATMRFSRTMLRGTIAEALYKLSTAPAAATVAAPQNKAG